MTAVWLYQKKILTFSYEFPAFWTLVIHLELVENRERTAISFTIKSSFWCTTLDDVITGNDRNHLMFDFLFVKSWCPVLHLHLRNMWRYCISCFIHFHQVMVFSTVNISKKTLNMNRKSERVPFSLCVWEKFKQGNVMMRNFIVFVKLEHFKNVFVSH